MIIKHRDFEIDREKVINDLIALCSIRSPSGEEKEVAEYIITWAKYRGLSIEYIDALSGNAPNMLIRIDGEKEGPVILLSAHIDTVPVPANASISVLYEDGIIKSDGSTILGSDDKAGVGAMLEMARIAQMYPTHHSGIELLFTVQEEIGCKGSSSVPFDILKSTISYNLDGETPPGSIIVSSVEKSRFVCQVHGKSAHAALEPDEGINAIRIASAIILALPSNNVSETATANVGSIKGGAQTNVVPDYVEFIGEIRSFSHQEFISLMALIDEKASSIAKEMGGATYIIWEHLYDGYHVDFNTECVSRFVSSCNDVGIIPSFLSSRGGGDSNVINSRGIESVVFGLGMNHIHTKKEFIRDSEYLLSIDLLAHVLFSR
jgi:tripeptide aminopeptidase